MNFTTSLYKSFAIYGTARFELRFESFNTFNHTEFNGMNTTYYAFWNVMATSPARRIRAPSSWAASSYSNLNPQPGRGRYSLPRPFSSSKDEKTIFKFY